MPYTNYCKKCKEETPVGETCPRCGAKLTRTGERLSFRMERTPVKDFFAWNAMLRIVVPVIGIVLLTTITIEGFTEGVRGIQSVFIQGFFGVLLGALCVLLLLAYFVLLLQGKETVQYLLDGKGIRVKVYVRNLRAWQRYSRLLSHQALEALAEEAQEPKDNNLVLVRNTFFAWVQIKRCSTWTETQTILLYAPSFWQVCCIPCTNLQTFEEVYGHLQKKVRQHKRKRARRR